MSLKRINKSQGYWIYRTSYYCPQCGRSRDYRERVYDRPKPVKWEERNLEIEAWDYCGI